MSAGCERRISHRRVQVLGNVSFLVEVVLLQVLIDTDHPIALDRATDIDGGSVGGSPRPARNPVTSARHWRDRVRHRLPRARRCRRRDAAGRRRRASGADRARRSLHSDQAPLERMGTALSVITALKLVAQP